MRAKKGCETHPEPAGEMKFARRASPAAVLAVFENKNYVYFRRGVGNYAQPAHVRRDGYASLCDKMCRLVRERK